MTKIQPMQHMLALAVGLLAATTPDVCRRRRRGAVLRGATPIDKTPVPDMFKQEKDRPPIPRDYLSSRL